MAIDVQRMKQRLEAKRDELAHDIAELTEAHPEPVGTVELNDVPGDFEDQAVDVEESDKERLVQENEQSLLEQVNAALERIKQGAYGICTNCGELIDEKRLEAIPWATLCIKCSKQLDTSNA